MDFYGGVAGLFLLGAGATQAGAFPLAAPAAVFETSSVETVRRIVDACLREGEPVIARAATTVTCEIPLDRPTRIAARLLLLEPFTRTPRAFVRFAVSPTDAGTSRVAASGWVEDARPLRHRRVVRLGGARFIRRMQDFLSGAGGDARPA